MNNYSEITASAETDSDHLGGFDPIYRKDETETVSHSLITKFETEKTNFTNLRLWPRPLLQNFKTKKIVVKNDVSSGGG